MHKHPSKDYIAMLDIKLIIRDWQDLKISDTDALVKIAEIIKTRT